MQALKNIRERKLAVAKTLALFAEAQRRYTRHIDARHREARQYQHAWYHLKML